MGYTTEFIGKFVFDKEPSMELMEYINCFSKTRHVKRDVEAVKSIFPDYEERSWKGVLGDSAEFFLQPCDEVIYKKDDRLDMAGFYKRNGIIDDNKPPLTQPGLWCHWIINSRGELVWNGAEKFYCYVEWLEYLIVNFFAPEGLMLSGRCFYSGEKMDDWGYIVVDNNHVEKIPNNISTFDQDDIICVRMPYVIKEELEKKVAYKYGISLEQTLQRFITWCAVEPESFTSWYRESRKKNVDYTRTGSTLHVLEGQELERAVLQSTGLTWDSFGVDSKSVSDLDHKVLDVFREKAVEKKRLTPDQAGTSDEKLVSKLNLLTDNGKLTRAALMLFSNPESIVTGAYIKIGFFAPDGTYGDNTINDVLYHDEVRGPLVEQADKAIDLLYSKYMKALISYSGIQRVESYMIPQDAMREIILNAIAHKNYPSGNPIQIKVYDDHITIMNEGFWPFEFINVEDAYTDEHDSHPNNPKIAEGLYMAGDIETWGSGFDKIKKACVRYGAPLPVITATKGMVNVRINPAESYMKVLEKTRKNAGNIAIGNGNLAIADENLAIEGGNLAIESKKLANKSEKIDYGIIVMRISAKNYNEPTPSNINIIYKATKANQVFGASDIKELLDCSYATAKNIISKLYNEIEVIVPEKKHGKGKYRFKNYDEV